MAQATTTRTATTRAALLEGALHEFSAFGYRRSSMESVARRAGVSRATLYVHWSGKEELFREAVALYRATDGAPTQRALAEEPTARGDHLPFRDDGHASLDELVEEDVHQPERVGTAHAGEHGRLPDDRQHLAGHVDDVLKAVKDLHKKAA